MKQKAILKKPYTDTQKALFITQYKYGEGCKIEETVKSLKAYESNNKET